MSLPGRLSAFEGFILGKMDPSYRSKFSPSVLALQSSADEGEFLAGSTRYSFNLALWPRLCWVIHERPGGALVEAGFRSRVPRLPPMGSLATLSAGDWTRRDLERAAVQSTLADGWEDELLWRFDFGDQSWFGRFVYDLLQEWKSVEA
jgi:hypothetical protein